MKASINGGPIPAQELAELRVRLGLSPRQTEVVTHLLSGKADKQIAREMNITVPTVRMHMGRLFREFGAHDRVELILCLLAKVRGRDGRPQTQEHLSLQRKNT